MATELSPDWWRDTLDAALQTQAHNAAHFERYYDGNFPDYGLVTTKYREQFAAMLRAIQDNWMQLIVDAEAERMHVEGFRFGSSTEADDDAWEMWQRSNLDSDSGIAHTTALTTGRAYMLVTPPGNGSEWPTITVEHPTQMIVATDPSNRRNRLAALKRWTDEWTGADRATLYLPDAILKWARAKNSTNEWAPFAEPMPNPLGVVPVVPMSNRPDLFGGARSELETVTSTQDQINKLVCDMIVASEFQAFQQRWGTGVELETDEESGEVVKPWSKGPGEVWTVPDPDARFGSFPNTDLTAYPVLLENRIQSLASRTRTPPHYLLGGMGDFPSGESIKATETGLVAKARAQMRHCEEAWEETIRLGFLTMNDPRSEAFGAETIWRDPESRTDSEHVDSLVKLRALHVPLQQLWEDKGYSPQQIARFRSMLVEEAFVRAMLPMPEEAEADDPATASVPDELPNEPVG